MTPEKPFKYGRLEDMNSDDDIAYWQSQNDTAKFKEAWRLVELAYELKGIPKHELRFQRSIATFQRQKS